MKTALLTAALFCILTIWGEVSAQVRYPVVGSNEDIIVIENPPDQNLTVGDRFYILRRKGLQEVALAIAEVELFKGTYCRLRIVERILPDQPREGDYLIYYDPTRYTPWGDGFDLLGETPAQPEYSSAFADRPSPSKTELMFAVYSGFGLSDFDPEELYGPNTALSQSAYLPLGAQFLVRVNIFHFGAEFNYAVVPFVFENQGGNGQILWEDRLSQLMFGALMRVNLLKGYVKPFLRAGGGIYTGDAKREYSETFKEAYLDLYGEELTDETIQLDTNFGFNIGAGIAIPNGFIEFVYHFVDRSQKVMTLDSGGNQIQETERFKAHNWAFQVGAQIPLN